MGAAAVVALLAGRPAARWHALLLATAVTLALNPRAIEDVGWQLSFAAVVAILLLAGRVRDGLVRRGLPRGLADATALTAAATLGTAPLIALHFGQASLVSLPANVLAAPAVAPAMWLADARGRRRSVRHGTGRALRGARGLPRRLRDVGRARREPPARSAGERPRGSRGRRVPGRRGRRHRAAGTAADRGRRRRGGGARRAAVAHAGGARRAGWAADHLPRRRSGRRDADPVAAQRDPGRRRAARRPDPRAPAPRRRAPARPARGHPCAGRSRRRRRRGAAHAAGGARPRRARRPPRRQRRANGGAGRPARRPRSSRREPATCCASAVSRCASSGPRAPAGPPTPAPTPTSARSSPRPMPAACARCSPPTRSPTSSPGSTWGRSTSSRSPITAAPIPGCPRCSERLRPRLAAIEVGRRNVYRHPAAATVRALRAAGAAVVRTDRDGSVGVEPAAGGLRIHAHA